MDPRNLHPVILAGGLGTRLRRVLGDMPKPMARVAGRPFIEWVLRYLQEQGFTRATLSIGYRAEVFEEHFAENPMPGMDVELIAEPEPLGTAGGFRNAIRTTTEYDASFAGWLVMNGDSLLLADLNVELADVERRNCVAAIFARHVDDAGRYGSITIADNNQLTNFAEKSPESKPGWINAGVYAIFTEMLEHLTSWDKCSFETDQFPACLRQNVPIRVVRSQGAFLDIGTEQSFASADCFVEANSGMFHRN